MSYPISTSIIYEKFQLNSECPLCELKETAEEQFVHQFLNDAVMENSTRKKVNELGFCERHFNMLFSRPNKLSLALQIYSHLDKNILPHVYQTDNLKGALKQVEFIKKTSSTCIICDLIEERMQKYYITFAKLYKNEQSFRDAIKNSNGFCLNHYAKLIEHASNAGSLKAEYLNDITCVTEQNLERLNIELKVFCDSHDYRNSYKPLGSSATAINRMGIKLYGKPPKKIL